MILVDTGYFLGMAIPSDHLHERSMAWTKSLAAETFVVTESVLIESVNALSRTAFRSKARNLIDSVLGGTRIASKERPTTRRDQNRRRPASHTDKEWALIDCISFHLMASRGISRVLSHDHHFEQAGFEALLRHDPL